MKEQEDEMGDRPTVTLTVGQAVVRFLAAQWSERDGVRRRVVPAMMGIFGHGNAVGLGEACLDPSVDLPFLQPKNEQSMVHTAIGYAKASQRMATLACTASIGPGATNMVTGAATATINRLPVLLLPSDTFANRRQGPVLQQLEHAHGDVTVNDCFRPVSVFFDRISRPEQLLTALPAAIRVLLDPAATGAVTISLHQDVQGEAFDFPAELFDTRVWAVSRRPAAADDLDRAAAVIAAAQRPLLIAGGGVRYSGAEAASQTFSSTFGVPVAETSAGCGTIVEGLLMGGLGVNGTAAANAAAAAADVVICVGTRLTDFTTGSHSLFQHPDVTFVGVNIAPADAYKLGGVAVVADAASALGELQVRLSGAGWRASEQWTNSCADDAARWRGRVRDEEASGPGQLTQGGVLTAINQVTAPDDWVIAAAGGPPGDLLKTWQAKTGVHTHIEFGYSCMGHELPAALGVRLAQSDRGRVFAVIGDGTFLMANSEIVTAVQEGLDIVVIILVNDGYQSIHHLQLGAIGTGFGNEFRHRDPATRTLTGAVLDVDYASIVEGLGGTAFEARTGDGFRDALKAAASTDGPVAVVCHVGAQRVLPGDGPFWDLGVPAVSHDPTIGAAADQVRNRATAQRIFLDLPTPTS